MQVRAERNVAEFRGSAVVADHAVGEHREVMHGAVAIEPEGASAIDRIDDHQLAGEIDSLVGRRNSLALGAGGCLSCASECNTKKPRIKTAAMH